MMTIRRVLPEEAHKLSHIALAAKRYWGYPARWIELWIPQLTFDPQYFQDNESWAADMDGEPFAFYTLLEKESMAWLENLWVNPTHMGKGTGKLLFQHAVGLARSRGNKLLRLEADPNALGFYEKMGMHKTGEWQSEVDGQLRLLPIMEIIL